MDCLTVSCFILEKGCKIDWPAWVQAIGSIGAIVFAGYLARSTEVQAVNDNNKIIQITLTDFKQSLQGIVAAINATNDAEYESHKNEFRQIWELADSIDLRLAPYVAVVHLITIKRYIHEINDAINTIDTRGMYVHRNAAFYQKYFDRSENPIAEINKVIRDQKWWKLSR